MPNERLITINFDIIDHLPSWNTWIFILLQTEDPEAAFDCLFAERLPLYAEADLHVEVGVEEPDGIALKIIEFLPQLLSPPVQMNG